MIADANQIKIEAYYKEIDPDKREKILMELLQENPAEENELRKEIFYLRYAAKSQRGDNHRADGYLRLWMTMKYTVENGGSIFGNSRNRKELTKILEELGIPEIQKKGEIGEHLLYQEFYHMATVYMDISLRDKNYTSSMMGFMTMKDDQIQGKITKDVCKVAILMPKKVGMEEEFSIFTRATKDAFCNRFPDCREQLDNYA